MVPNLPHNLYYVSRIVLHGENNSWRGMRFGGKRKISFTPVPGKVIYVGEWQIELPKNGKSRRSHFRVLTQEVKSYLSQRFPRTPWLARQFIEALR